MNKPIMSGQGFHTGLRKAVDSQASSILWNAIHLTTEGQWDRFLAAVNNQDESLNLEQRCRRLYLFGESALNLIMIGLRMLTSEEYAALEDYCTAFDPDVPDKQDRPRANLGDELYHWYLETKHAKLDRDLVALLNALGAQMPIDDLMTVTGNVAMQKMLDRYFG